MSDERKTLWCSDLSVDQFFALTDCFCPECKVKWDDLLEDRIKEFTPCEECCIRINVLTRREGLV